MNPPRAGDVEYALGLIATAEIEAPTAAAAARTALAEWRDVSPAHAAACQEAERRWQMLGSLAAEACRSAPAARHRGTRRAVITDAVLAGATALGAGLWRQYLDTPLYAGDYSTVTAQLRKDWLPDGSVVELDAQTRLHASLYPRRRSVQMDQGRARFDVAPDADRPFVVRTRIGRVEVLGTAFSVSMRGSGMAVAVAHGRVRVIGSGGAAVALNGGQRVVLDEGGTPGAVQAVAPGDVGAWRSGWLVFDGTPLADALPTINAYLRRPIALADTAAGDLRLTARLRAADAESLLAALPTILPLRVLRGTGGEAVLALR